MARPFGSFKFKTPGDFNKKIEKYFNSLKEKEMPTKGGLSLFLGITKDSLGDYEKRKNYSYSLKRAYNLIEDVWTQKLAGQSVAGVIFYLKNAFKKDWRDRYDTDITSGNKPIAILTNALHSNNRNKEDNETAKENQDNTRGNFGQ